MLPVEAIPVVSVVPPNPGRTRSLEEVAAFLGVAVSGRAEGAVTGAVTGALTGVAQHTDRVRPGSLYVARPGLRAHGAAFAPAAAEAGALAALTDETGSTRCEAAGLTTLVVPDPAAVLGPLSAWFHDYPSRAFPLLGVTGTNGKTTTTYLLDAALRAAGHRTGLIGTVETRIGDEVLSSVRTTPEAPDLQALFAEMRSRGVTAASMEVSSHALQLGRVTGTSYAVSAFTNLSQDHLEQHGDFESYYRAKASLFTPELTALAVVNVDDAHGCRLASEIQGLEVVTVSPSGRAASAAWSAGPITYAPDGSLHFEIRGPEDFRLPVTLGIPGDFNVENAVIAAAMLRAIDVDPPAIAAAFADVRMPGRMERIDAPEGGRSEITAIVDYAHTPDAIAGVLASVRRGMPAGARLIAVFGCGGDRDPTKREGMGEAASRGADVAVLTDDNPRSEDPAAIRAAARAGAERVPERERAQIVEVGGRREAIFWAVEHAAPGDIVLVLGKGHEKGQEIHAEVQPFDDRVVTEEALTATGVRR